MKIYQIWEARVSNKPVFHDPNKKYFNDFLETNDFFKNLNNNSKYYLDYPVEIASDGKKFVLHDSISFSPSYTILVSEKVKEMFEKENLCSEIEFYPLTIKNVTDSFYIMLYYQVSKIDCLDKENSDIKYLVSKPNKPYSVNSYVFKEKPKNLFFRTPESETTLLCQESVIDVFREYKIKGFEFIWVEDPEYYQICNNGRLHFPKNYKGEDGRYIVLN